ncbi:hypothetical protein N9W34_05670, partial [Rickettsiales bacterium]|nr:hypothetical protein [Rickettsiales bacterium]
MIIRRTTIAALHDVVMAALSFAVAMYLRIGDMPHPIYQDLPNLTVLFAGICACVFWYCGLYKGMWRYASLQDMVAIAKSVTLSILIFIPLLFIITRLENFPRSMLVINAMVLMIFLGAPRVLYRILKDKDMSNIFRSGLKDERT